MGSGGLNGAWYVQGLQTGLSGGAQTTLGPFGVPFSGAQAVQTYTSTGGTIFIPTPNAANLSPPDPPNANGVWIIPPPTNTETIVFNGANDGTIDIGFSISKVEPTFIKFDHNNDPEFVILTVGGAITLGIQFT